MKKDHHRLLSTNEVDLENENIYKIKYIYSQNDKILPEGYEVGSYSGVLLNRKISQMDRFKESQALLVKSDQLERSVLNLKFDKFLKLVERKSINYGIKGFLGLVFFNSILNRRHLQEKHILNKSNKIACPKNMIISGGIFAGSLILI